MMAGNGCYYVEIHLRSCSHSVPFSNFPERIWEREFIYLLTCLRSIIGDGKPKVSRFLRRRYFLIRGKDWPTPYRPTRYARAFLPAPPFSSRTSMAIILRTRFVPRRERARWGITKSTRRAVPARFIARQYNYPPRARARARDEIRGGERGPRESVRGRVEESRKSESVDNERRGDSRLFAKQSAAR